MAHIVIDAIYNTLSHFSKKLLSKHNRSLEQNENFRRNKNPTLFF